MKKLLAVTTAVAVTGSFAATADAAEHTVQSGDTLWGISKEYGTSVAAIKAENGLSSNLIMPNQVLKVNEKTSSDSSVKMYKIIAGDTLGKIADKFDVTVAQLKDWNNLSSDLIIAGKTLKVQAVSVAPAAPVKTETAPAVQAPTKVYTAPKAETAPVQQQSYTAPKAETTSVQQQTLKTQSTYTAPKAQTATTTTSASTNSGLNWSALAACEAGGNASINTGNGFYGLYQFDLQTWQSVGGTGLPSNASAAEQTKRAQILYNQRGSQPWPVCGAQL